MGSNAFLSYFFPSFPCSFMSASCPELQRFFKCSSSPHPALAGLCAPHTCRDKEPAHLISCTILMGSTFSVLSSRKRPFHHSLGSPWSEACCTNTRQGYRTDLVLAKKEFYVKTITNGCRWEQKTEVSLWALPWTLLWAAFSFPILSFPASLRQTRSTLVFNNRGNSSDFDQSALARVSGGLQLQLSSPSLLRSKTTQEDHICRLAINKAIPSFRKIGKLC